MGTTTKFVYLAAFLLVLVAWQCSFVQGDGDGRKDEAAVTHYEYLGTTSLGNEHVRCEARGKCTNQTLSCPDQCKERKPVHNKKQKGCFIDCSSRCEVTCKWRKPRCDGYGSLCYDPRLVGGDGVMFYFHGEKGGNFAIVSDDNLQINAHLIGTRPAGRTRDYTWVQALSIMFGMHTLTIAAKKISRWDDRADAVTLRWNGETVDIPTDGQEEWRANCDGREILVERTDGTNTLRVVVAGLVELAIRVRPIGKEENRVHNYQLPDDDAFAHLETQFKFFELTDLVEGVLGRTYRPNYVSPVKVGVAMPVMGGEDKYRTPSPYSTACKVCRFHRPSGGVAENS